MFVIPVPIVTVVRLLQFLNAPPDEDQLESLPSILVIPSGILIVVISEFPNTFCAMVPVNALPLPNATSLKCEPINVRPKKPVLVLNDVTLSGIVKVVELSPIPKNAVSPKAVTVEGITVVLQPNSNLFVEKLIIALQLFLESNVAFSASTVICVTVLGVAQLIEVIDLPICNETNGQPVYVSDGIVVKPSPVLKDVSPLSRKTFVSIPVTLSGIVTDVKPVNPLNALLSMYVVSLGMTPVVVPNTKLLSLVLIRQPV
jgi:hypothetical protein